MKQRSFGISVLAILLVVFSVWGIVSSVQALNFDKTTQDISEMFKDMLFFMSKEEKALLFENSNVRRLLFAYKEIIHSEDFKTVMRANAIMCLVIALLGIGVLMLQNWARILTIAFFIVSVPVYMWLGNVFFKTTELALKSNLISSVLYLKEGLSIITVLSISNFILLAVNALAIGYIFTRPEVKLSFCEETNKESKNVEIVLDEQKKEKNTPMAIFSIWFLAFSISLLISDVISAKYIIYFYWVSYVIFPVLLLLISNTFSKKALFSLVVGIWMLILVPLSGLLTGIALRWFPSTYNESYEGPQLASLSVYFFIWCLLIATICAMVVIAHKLIGLKSKEVA